MKTIYVVVGSTGEYSDRREWFVAAYTEEKLARSHAELAKARASELYPTYEEWRHRGDSDLSKLNPYDPEFLMDYTGTDYSVAPVPVLKSVPRPRPS